MQYLWKDGVLSVSLDFDVVVSFFWDFVHGLLELHNIADSELSSIFLSKIEVNQTSLITNDSL